MLKWVIRKHFRHVSFNSFPMVQRSIQSNSFWHLELPLEKLGVHRNTNSQNENSIIHTFLHSYIPSSMKYNSQIPLLACTFARPCFAPELKVNVAIFKWIHVKLAWTSMNIMNTMHYPRIFHADLLKDNILLHFLMNKPIVDLINPSFIKE